MFLQFKPTSVSFIEIVYLYKHCRLLLCVIRYCLLFYCFSVCLCDMTLYILSLVSNVCHVRSMWSSVSQRFYFSSHLQLPQTKTTTAQRFRPLDSTSDPHLHINGQPQAPMLRHQYRGVPPLAKVRAPHNSQQTGRPPPLSVERH